MARGLVLRGAVVQYAQPSASGSSGAVAASRVISRMSELVQVDPVAEDEVDQGEQERLVDGGVWRAGRGGLSTAVWQCPAGLEEGLDVVEASGGEVLGGRWCMGGSFQVPVMVVDRVVAASLAASGRTWL